MRVVVAGTRNFSDYEALKKVLDQIVDDVEEVVSGCATGADQLGEVWARENNIPVKQFPADWEQYGRYAGPIRNRQMAEYCDYAAIFWDGESHGTRSMINEMKRLQKPFIVYRYNWNGKG